MIELKAKEAAEARARLGQVLEAAAKALQQVACVITACAVELEQATTAEATATGNYVAALEQQISRQRELS